MCFEEHGWKFGQGIALTRQGSWNTDIFIWAIPKLGG